ncbi:MAG: hypothetical protein ACYCZ2_09910 [Lutibacter sp.]
MKIIKSTIIFLFSIALIFGCDDKNDKPQNATTNSEKTGMVSAVKQLNITILLDLSDRIEPSKYPNKPEHFERDIEIVNHFTEMFKREMESKGAYSAKGKLKVIFSPRPLDDEINRIASKLNVDLSKAINPKEKKIIFDNLSSSFRENLKTIYAKTIETKKYIGSDIWRFFKNDVVDYALNTDPDIDYRNILVIITDGYLYHSDSKILENNRSPYLLPETIEKNGLRKPDWKETFNTGDYGFITKRDNLDKLDILVLEVNPSQKHKDDEDIIKAYLSKWFDEMKVNKYEIYNTDLPEYTKAKIDKFIKNV